MPTPIPFSQWKSLQPAPKTNAPIPFSQYKANLLAKNNLNSAVSPKPQTPMLTTGDSSNFGKNLLGAGKDVATGLVKSGIQTARGVSQMLQGGGQRLISLFSGQKLSDVQKNTGFQSLNDNAPTGQGVASMLQPKSTAEKTGNVVGDIAQLLAPFAGETGGLTGLKNDWEGIKNTPKAIKDFLTPSIETTEKLFGKKAADIKTAVADPIAKEFQTGERTLASTGEKIKSGITSFVKNGRDALNAVFDQLPKDISVKTSDIIDAVNNGMQKVVGALQKSTGATLNDINDLLTKTKFSPDEQKIVSNLVDKVNSWIKVPENTSPRGLAELRRVLYDQFTRGDGSLSDQVVSKINTELKNLISSSSKEYGPALGRAVDNIDNAERISKQFLDKDGNLVESKLASFAKKLKDPALGGDIKTLFNNILGGASKDVLGELDSFNNSKILQQLEKEGTGIVGKAKKIATATGIGGGILAGGKGIYDLITTGKP